MMYYIIIFFINIHFAQFKSQGIGIRYLSILIEFVALLLPCSVLIKLITSAA